MSHPWLPTDCKTHHHHHHHHNLQLLSCGATREGSTCNLDHKPSNRQENQAKRSGTWSLVCTVVGEHLQNSKSRCQQKEEVEISREQGLSIKSDLFDYSEKAERGQSERCCDSWHSTSVRGFDVCLWKDAN